MQIKGVLKTADQSSLIWPFFEFAFSDNKNVFYIVFRFSSIYHLSRFVRWVGAAKIF